jgi:hypothetical protein
VEHHADGSADVGRVHSGECVTQSTGMPSARLAASRSTLRSPPLAGRPPSSRAVIAPGQSIAAMAVMPSVMLVPMST